MSPLPPPLSMTSPSVKSRILMISPENCPLPPDGGVRIPRSQKLCWSSLAMVELLWPHHPQECSGPQRFRVVARSLCRLPAAVAPLDKQLPLPLHRWCGDNQEPLSCAAAADGVGTAEPQGELVGLYQPHQTAPVCILQPENCCGWGCRRASTLPSGKSQWHILFTTRACFDQFIGVSRVKGTKMSATHPSAAGNTCTRTSESSGKRGRSKKILRKIVWTSTGGEGVRLCESDSSMSCDLK